MSLSIGITCYPTFGGSGIVATEIGLGLARRGHRVHFICSDVPRRLDRSVDNVFFHQVRAMDYPVFPQVPYSLALCSAMVSVATWHGLDVLHAHYAVPHATAAWMAKEVLGGGPRVVTTLHGTDITLVGSDESYLPITRHSILKSDAVTAPSADLRSETWSRFDLDSERVPIDVIPNSVDTDLLRPLEGPGRPRLEALFGPEAGRVPTVVHVSNFRPLKRVDRVVEAFARVAADRPGFLLLIGDGPERTRVEAAVRREGLVDRVRLLGGQDHFEDVLRECAVFLLTSEAESFGLAALEALASGVPVVAFRVGGVPEVVRDGQTGILVPPGDVNAMAAALAGLLDDPDRRDRFARAARSDVVDRFRMEPMVDRYERVYERVLEARR
jgi:N-acetyl-alpha-D-glucosaminyl L-malate synthase BshA